jgi:hypothetical protein
MRFRQRVERIEKRVSPAFEVRITCGGEVWEGDFKTVLDSVKPTRGLPSRRGTLPTSGLPRPILVCPRRGESVEAAKRRVCAEHHLDFERETDFMVMETL